jgi:hypothetical protein
MASNGLLLMQWDFAPTLLSLGQRHTTRTTGEGFTSEMPILLLSVLFISDPIDRRDSCNLWTQLNLLAELLICFLDGSCTVHGRLQPLPDDQPTAELRAGDQVEGTIGNFSILQTRKGELLYHEWANVCVFRYVVKSNYALLGQDSVWCPVKLWRRLRRRRGDSRREMAPSRARSAPFNGSYTRKMLGDRWVTTYRNVGRYAYNKWRYF